MRSIWKSFYTDSRFDHKLQISRSRDRQGVKLPARNSTIVSVFVGKKVQVPKGLGYAKFTVKPFMVGHKFGEFAPTKLMGRTIHVRRKKKGK